MLSLLMMYVCYRCCDAKMISRALHGYLNLTDLVLYSFLMILVPTKVQVRVVKVNVNVGLSLPGACGALRSGMRRLSL